MPWQGLEPKTATDSHDHAKTTTSRSASFVPAGISARSLLCVCLTLLCLLSFAMLCLAPLCFALLCFLLCFA
jgi:hypothetical protein